jgi:UDP-N-acetyl-2-amino-2-deoxyglucuronate dehydrogenase
MEPNPYEVPHARQAELWIVWRIDDNGNTFVVADRLTQQAAERMVEEFTARGHKQTYWAEKSE